AGPRSKVYRPRLPKLSGPRPPRPPDPRHRGVVSVAFLRLSRRWQRRLAIVGRCKALTFDSRNLIGGDADKNPDTERTQLAALDHLPNEPFATLPTCRQRRDREGPFVYLARRHRHPRSPVGGGGRGRQWVGT